MTDQECPFCKSTEITCGETYRKQSFTTRLMGCDVCEGEFTFVYTGDPTAGNLAEVIETFEPVPSRPDRGDLSGRRN